MLYGRALRVVKAVKGGTALCCLAAMIAACGGLSLADPSYIPGMSGIVRDAVTNAPISGATVQAQGKASVSEQDGAYSFDRLSFSSSLTITARKEGYRDYSETIDGRRETSGYGILRDIKMTKL